MRLLLRAPLSVLLSLSFGLLLLSCAEMPPDVPGCTPYPATDWPAMRDSFFKLCADDPVCAVNLPKWRTTIASWTMPSDAGTCVTWMSARVLDVDAAHPMPGKYTDTGKAKTWPELMVGGVMLPAKEAAAPLKTFVQGFCHDSNQCANAGNWQASTAAIDVNLKTQAAKVSALAAKPVAGVKKNN